MTCKTQNFFIQPTFLLITIVFLLAASIYKKHLLQFQDKNKQLREIM